MYMERELCCIFVKLVNNISAFFGHTNRVYSIKQIDTFIQAVFHTDLYMLLNLLKISKMPVQRADGVCGFHNQYG